MRKKAVQQGRSERRGESYSGPYVEPLSDARTPLSVFFRIQLEKTARSDELDAATAALVGRWFLSGQGPMLEGETGILIPALDRRQAGQKISRHRE
jgi:hypothetical protein